MRKLGAALGLILFAVSLQAHAQTPNGTKTIEQLEHTLGVAFMSKELGRLDAKRPYLGSLRIVIEHSLAADDAKDRFEIKSFSTLAQAEKWLKSREREDGTPIREARELLRCRKGVCVYSLDGGISHNHLYLKKFTYVLRRGRPYIKTMYLLDGD